MWLSFCIAFFLVVVALYLPGYFSLRTLFLSRTKAFAASPVVSLFAYDILVVVYKAAEISVTFFSLVGAVSFLALAIFLLTRFVQRDKSPHSSLGVASFKNALSTLSAPFLYVVIPLVLVTYFFLIPLDGPNSFIQGFDALYHLGLVRSFADSGQMSFLSCSLYLDGSTAGPSIPISSSFYPASWHCIGAIVLQIVGGSAALTANAENAVIVSFVFPLGVMLLLDSLFPNQRKTVLIGSFVSLAFASYPWMMILRGEQYPQMLSFALLPIACALLVSYSKGPRKQKLAGICLIGVSIVSITLAQPNGFFSYGVFGLFFVSSLLAKKLKNRSKSFQFRMLSMGCYFFACALLWFAFYKIPFLDEVVSYSWDPFATNAQALINVITLSLNQTSTAPQLLLSFFIFVGIFESLAKRENLWITATFVFVAFSYIVDVSSSGSLKQFLTGFWYTDPDRIAAMLAIFSIPLVCRGVISLESFCSRLMPISYRGIRASNAIRAFVGVLLVVGVFCPSFYLPGFGNVKTPFGDAIDRIVLYSGDSGVFDKAERDFIDKVAGDIPEGALVLGCPHDGSGYAYATNNINMFYRRDSGGETESQESKTIRLNLSNIENDSSVRDAAQSIGAEYVVLLDCEAEKGIGGFFHSYVPSEWSGILSINESTPGFELEYAEGDMRLYKIE